MSAYINHGKTASTKRNSLWKSTLIEREGLFRKITELLQHRWTAAELIIHLEDPVSTKTVRRKPHKPNVHGRAATAKPLINESNAQMHKQLCRDHKTWTSTTRNARVIWSDELSFTLFPTSGRVYVWRTHKGAYNPECWLQQRNTRKVLWWFGNQYRGTVFCQSHYYHSWLNYCMGVRGQVG
jgi:hypothetical protein